MLDLQAATTLSANDQVTGQNPVSFEDVHFNGNVLTLGSASTHLKVNDALALSGIALETGAGSLSLSGALALTDNASLNSSGGTITLVSGASAPSGTSYFTSRDNIGP